jgi:electron transfer flavoprotein alpha subunit
LSYAFDTAVSGAGATGGGDLARAGASRGLLLVLEPGGAETPAGAALLVEGRHLAARMGVEARAATWDAGTTEAVVASDVVVELGAVAEALAAQVRSMRAAAVLLADSEAGRELAPLLAFKLGTGAVLGCAEVLIDGDTSSLCFVKPVYGGWLEQDVSAGADAVAVATLDLAGIDVAVPAGAASPSVGVLAVAGDAVRVGARVQHLELLPPDAKSVDLVHARRIVAAGMGATGGELLSVVHELADLLDGSVGATRPVVDEGRLPKERLIGQTGRSVTPDLYVALGLSGSPHHVAGVRKADTIIAVNRDPRAPIFQFSDVGYVADLGQVLPALVTRIKEWRDAGE